MDQEEMEETLHQAEDRQADEEERRVPASTYAQHRAERISRSCAMNASDVAALRAKHVFLADFSDNFIRSTAIGDLMKIEMTSLKIKELERNKDVDDKLAANKTALSSTFTEVQAGRDNRSSVLHSARFLAGASCATTKQWLGAKAVLGDSNYPAVGSYDMGSVGLAGYVSAKGWAELHNLSSSKLSIKLFNINSFSTRQKKPDDDTEETLDMAEFKLAVRVMRTAFSMALPWNFSVLALEGFFYQNNFCAVDLANTDKKVWFLVKFTDYVLQLNVDRWRDSEPFLTTGELKTTWAAFFGAQPHSATHKKDKKPHQQSKERSKDPKVMLGICFNWNNGTCLKAANACTTTKGRPLKHICDFAADPAKPTDICGKDHIRKNFH